MAKIIQILEIKSEMWRGRMLGLGDDGITYECGTDGKWHSFIPELERGVEQPEPSAGYYAKTTLDKG